MTDSQNQLLSTSLSPITPQSSLQSIDRVLSQGNGLKAEYYDNIDFTNLKQTRTDPTVNFNWGEGSSDPSIGADTFSVRWTGQVEAKYSETYNFYTTSDDGVQLWVNGQQIINKFVDQPATQHSGAIALVAGQKYDIKLEYYENKYDAVSQLSWSSSSQTKEIIPQSQLYSPNIQTTITLGSSSTTLNEGAGSVSITLLRTGDLSSTSSVKYATLAGTATAGVDYGSEGTESAGTLIFAPGQSSREISIPINDDSLAETDETFSFVIDQTQGATLGLQRTLGITIQDNDRSSLDFTQPVVNEDDGTATVTVTRGNSSGAASLDYITLDGTAKAGSDYQAVSGTLAFAAGEVSKTISIVLKNDTVGEVNETFTLNFSNAVGVQLNTQQTTITIIDDDAGNFALETVASGLNQPTAFDWTSDGKSMFIAQKNGVVRVLNNGTLLSTPFINISGQVNDTRDRGLLGIAVHPDFGKDTNPKNYVYLLYTYDPPETNPNNSKNNPNSTLDNPDQNGNRTARLIRVEADPNTNYTTAIAGSEVVLLGTNGTWENISNPDGNSTNVSLGYAPSGILNKDTGKPFTSLQDYLNNQGKVQNVQNFIANDSESHSVGSVRFGTDGSLFVSLGDGTSYNGIDPRSIRVQDVNNLSGKILRIDAITGEGLSSNPFYNGDPNSNSSKVYNLGLRNPFRFTIDKNTNTPVIGDVGFNSYEEVNIGKPGANFGWPFYEGGLDTNGSIVNLKQPNYASLDAAEAFYSSGKPVTAPAYTYKHFSSNSITMGDFYTGSTFPSVYQGALFIADSSQGTIDAVKFDSQGKLVSVKRFASQADRPNLGVPVQITTGKDGNLYYANLTGGEIDRFIPV
ncbi:MAG TPA: Calx-beta domain-containing protein [Nostoc sp.]|uniref:Calx-beta domain-containing protein n=1 Tax=Nostoc sp. TaxID=1180 RepID=UPI002D672B4D|nr:Calx-beta domain-containing protein [Nostoc sp.]HYX15691.1 Calx-beta domain-containing protein [Nostoc sp.]